MTNQPFWFYLAIIESDQNSHPSTPDLDTLFEKQEGIRSHGWIRLSNRSKDTKRYLFQVISSTPINAELLYDISAILNCNFRVKAERTNSHASNTTFQSVIFIDTVADEDNQALSQLEDGLDDDTELQFSHGILTIVIRKDCPHKVINTQKTLERLIHEILSMSIITTFKNWKD